MKTIVHFLYAVFLGAVLLALFIYLFAVLDHPTLTLHHPEWFLRNLVYVIAYQYWVFSLFIAIYACIFFKTSRMRFIIFKFAFVVTVGSALFMIYRVKLTSITHVPPYGIFSGYLLASICLLLILRKTAANWWEANNTEQ